MADQFEKWDRFMRNYRVTSDAMKAKRWLAYEDWAIKRRRKFLVLHARHQAVLSLRSTDGRV